MISVPERPMYFFFSVTKHYIFTASEIKGAASTSRQIYVSDVMRVDLVPCSLW